MGFRLKVFQKYLDEMNWSKLFLFHFGKQFWNCILAMAKIDYYICQQGVIFRLSSAAFKLQVNVKTDRKNYMLLHILPPRYLSYWINSPNGKVLLVSNLFKKLFKLMYFIQSSKKILLIFKSTNFHILSFWEFL